MSKSMIAWFLTLCLLFGACKKDLTPENTVADNKKVSPNSKTPPIGEQLDKEKISSGLNKNQGAVVYLHFADLEELKGAESSDLELTRPTSVFISLLDAPVKLSHPAGLLTKFVTAGVARKAGEFVGVLSKQSTLGKVASWTGMDSVTWSDVWSFAGRKTGEAFAYKSPDLSIAVDQTRVGLESTAESILAPVFENAKNATDSFPNATELLPRDLGSIGQEDAIANAAAVAKNAANITADSVSDLAEYVSKSASADLSALGEQASSYLAQAPYLTTVLYGAATVGVLTQATLTGSRYMAFKVWGQPMGGLLPYQSANRKFSKVGDKVTIPKNAKESIRLETEKGDSSWLQKNLLWEVTDQGKQLATGTSSLGFAGAAFFNGSGGFLGSFHATLRGRFFSTGRVGRIQTADGVVDVDVLSAANGRKIIFSKNGKEFASSLLDDKGDLTTKLSQNLDEVKVPEQILLSAPKLIRDWYLKSWGISFGI